jgi:t-SNARE complex subunit (syntaxin)
MLPVPVVVGVVGIGSVKRVEVAMLRGVKYGERESRKSRCLYVVVVVVVVVVLCSDH